MSDIKRVLILGGGIAGMSLAIVLQRAGIAAEVAAIEQDAALVSVIFTDGTTAGYDLVVGADGVHSRLRAMLFPGAPPPVFTGQGCWRAVVPRPAAIDCAQVYVGGPVKAGIVPV